MGVRIECVLECENHLGEGPVWDVEEGRLYWVDGTGRRYERTLRVLPGQLVRTRFDLLEEP
jgi:sugar lactone lactonase YvrE